MGLYGDNGKENESYYSIGVINRDTGKEIFPKLRQRGR